MRVFFIVAIGLILAGCSGLGGYHCDGWRPIRPTVKDARTMSDSLATQILAYNEYGKKVGCWSR